MISYLPNFERYTNTKYQHFTILRGIVENNNYRLGCDPELAKYLEMK